jgi:hypothetical protein
VLLPEFPFISGMPVVVQAYFFLFSPMAAVEGVNGLIYVDWILSIKVASPAKCMMISDLLYKSLNISGKIGQLLSCQIICEILFALV